MAFVMTTNSLCKTYKSRSTIEHKIEISITTKYSKERALMSRLAKAKCLCNQAQFYHPLPNAFTEQGHNLNKRFYHKKYSGIVVYESNHFRSISILGEIRD